MAKNKKIIEGQISLFDLFTSAEDVHEEANTKQEIKTETLLRTGKDSVKQVTLPVKKLKIGNFKECTACWCRDCKHNACNEGIPRDICGNMQPCPACDMCISAGVAEICVIGSAEEGCSVRAAEEGFPEE